MGHLNIEHATEEILDIICDRVLTTIREIARYEKLARTSSKGVVVKVSVLNVDRGDRKIWVTPHCRCNGKTVTVDELEFKYAGEAKFAKLINSTPEDGTSSYMFLGLPDGRGKSRPHSDAIVAEGVSRDLAKTFFDKRSRAFLFHPIFHRNSASVVGLLKVESSSPICNPSDNAKRIKYSNALANCFSNDLVRLLGHCYQD